MSITILRTADAWWVRTPRGAARVETDATTTGELLATPERLDTASSSKETVDEATLDLLSPVTTPCRVVAQMTNFASHVEDAGLDPETIPLTFFRKTSGSISGPFDDIIRPEHVGYLDYEVEIGLVIGRELPVGMQVTEENWTSFVAGLVVTNDVSARDVQFSDKQWIRGKAADTFCPLGPVVVTTDEIPDPQQLAIGCRVNGETRQASHTREMIFSVAHIIAFISRAITLEPGDVILTGTPDGVGQYREPKVFLQPGDRVEVSLGDLGVLDNPIGPFVA